VAAGNFSALSNRFSISGRGCQRMEIITQIIVILLNGRELRNALRKRIQCGRHCGITSWQTSLLTTAGNPPHQQHAFIFEPEELHT
jgi:hypothetical protein